VFLRVGPNGGVQEVRVESERPTDPEQRACLERVIQAIIFPAAGGVLEGSVPLDFAGG
jgi:hypothetical protein